MIICMKYFQGDLQEYKPYPWMSPLPVHLDKILLYADWSNLRFAKGSESWHLNSSLCSLISLPQDTWRRHMLMRTDSPAAHIIRGREFYLNFGAHSDIQCDALKTHIWLHNDDLGRNMWQSLPTKTDDWMQRLPDRPERIWLEYSFSLWVLCVV